jgi:hypothetical protein
MAVLMFANKYNSSLDFLHSVCAGVHGCVCVCVQSCINNVNANSSVNHCVQICA